MGQHALHIRIIMTEYRSVYAGMTIRFLVRIMIFIWCGLRVQFGNLSLVVSTIKYRLARMAQGRFHLLKFLAIQFPMEALFMGLRFSNIRQQQIIV